MTPENQNAIPQASNPALASASGSDVRVRTPGPVTNLVTGEQTAVWPGDSIRVMSRVGSRRMCRVIYQHGECVSSFTALVPKRWLRVRRQNVRLTDGENPNQTTRHD